MSSPFRGMDPYIERPEIWPDFHHRFMTYLSAALKPLLIPRYVALMHPRAYIIETRLWREEVRQPLVEIIEPAAGDRVVTAFEVLSPDNKTAGAGRTSYLQKREEFWDSGTSLVEIDLLRQGEPTVRVAVEKLESVRPWMYLVAVTRRWPARQEVYPIPLHRRLPNIQVPLAPDDRDATLDLQAVLSRCWDEGPYPELLRYNEAPPGRMDPTDQAWCEQTVQTAGLRS